jgi:hypothetical protein
VAVITPDAGDVKVIKSSLHCNYHHHHHHHHHPSSRTMALALTQPLTEMNTRNLPGGKKRPARRADNLTAICEPNV